MPSRNAQRRRGPFGSPGASLTTFAVAAALLGCLSWAIDAVLVPADNLQFLLPIVAIFSATGLGLVLAVLVVSSAPVRRRYRAVDRIVNYIVWTTAGAGCAVWLRVLMDHIAHHWPS